MDRYQALTKIALNNWHYINRKVLSFHSEINFFTGHSGSGKSTVLDALQVVLYADTNGRNFFNKAAKEDSDRTLIEYLRGMKNVQDNGVASYLRNNNFSSTIVLEFEDTNRGEFQCIGVSFDVDTATNDINRLFFRHPGRLLENEYRSNERVLTSSEIRDYLKNQFDKDEIYYGRTNEAFRVKLYDEYFGGLDEKKFVSLFKRAIPFKMDMKLEEFVKEYICVEQDIHIDNMQESVTQYVRLKRRLEEVKLEIQSLEKVEEQFNRYHTVLESRTQLSYNGNRLELLYLEDEIQKSAEKQTVLKEDLIELKAKSNRLVLEREKYGNERDQVIVAIENSGFTHLQNEIESRAKLLKQYERSKMNWDKIASDLLCWTDVFCFQIDVLEGIEAFKNYQIDSGMLQLLKQKIALERGGVEEKKQVAIEQDNRIKQEVCNAESELKSLREGKKIYPKFVSKARETIKEKLFDQYNKEIAVEVLADTIEVKNEVWRNAVEGYMGNNKFALIVPPEYVRAAKEAYKSLDPTYFYKAAVIDTASILEHKKNVKAGALSEEIEVTIPYVRAYVDYLMGHVIKCGTMDELQLHKSAITSDCILYQGYKLQHINPKNYNEQAYIGEKAIGQKIDLLTHKINKLKEDGKPYQTAIIECNRVLSFEKLEQEEEHYFEYLTSILAIPQTEQEIAVCNERMKALREINIDEWKERKEFLDKAIRTKDYEKDETIHAMNKCEHALETIKAEYLVFNEKWKMRIEHFERVGIREENYLGFMKEKDGVAYQKLMSLCFQKNEMLKEKENTEYEKLTKVREEYQRTYAYRGLSISSRENRAYSDLLENLQSEKLTEFMEKANNQAKIAVNHFKTDFVFKIRDAIKEAIQQKDDLNRVLSKLDFGKDKYHFVITKNRGVEGKFYDMFMDKNLEINPSTLSDVGDDQMNLFSMEHETRYNDYMNELLDLFMPPEMADAKALEDARANLERYADYRTYLSFDMEQRVEGMPVMRLSKMLSKNSGGEGQNPLYVALLASFAQIYRINLDASVRRKPSIRLVVLDEAFSKMDGEKVGSCIGLIRKLGVQAIISATNDKIQNYVDNVDKTFVFANPNKTNISIQEFERQEFFEL
ncbi:MAG: ATP-binding protein [Velocimicrobium sp.]